MNVIVSKSHFHSLEIELNEGKNREIRKILSHFNLKITKPNITAKIFPFALNVWISKK